MSGNNNPRGNYSPTNRISAYFPEPLSLDGLFTQVQGCQDLSLDPIVITRPARKRRVAVPDTLADKGLFFAAHILSILDDYSERTCASFDCAVEVGKTVGRILLPLTAAAVCYYGLSVYQQAQDTLISTSEVVVNVIPSIPYRFFP